MQQVTPQINAILGCKDSNDKSYCADKSDGVYRMYILQVF